MCHLYAELAAIKPKWSSTLHTVSWDIIYIQCKPLVIFFLHILWCVRFFLLGRKKWKFFDTMHYEICIFCTVKPSSGGVVVAVDNVNCAILKRPSSTFMASFFQTLLQNRRDMNFLLWSTFTNKDALEVG